MEKPFVSRSFLTIFIFGLAVIPLLLAFFANRGKINAASIQHDNQLLARLQNNKLLLTPTPTLTPIPTEILALIHPQKTTIKTISPTITPQPTLVTVVMQVQEAYNWTTYKNKSAIASSFSFSYPAEWHVTYKKDPAQANTYQFQFTQENQSQVMTIVVYSPAVSPEAFIAANYPNELTSEMFGAIGSTPLYRLNLNDSITSEDPLYESFGSRGLVLGKKHSYVISFDSNPDHTMIDAIEKTIWPTFTFK